MSDRISCPLCSRSVRESTLHKYGGCCRACSKRAKTLRFVSLGAFLFGLAVFTLPSILQSQIETAAAVGRPAEGPWLMALTYNTLGPVGFQIVCYLLGLLLLGVGLRNGIQWRALSQQIAGLSQPSKI